MELTYLSAHPHLAKILEVALAALVVVVVVLAFRLRSREKISGRTFNIIITSIQIVGSVVVGIYSWKTSKSGLRIMEQAFGRVMHYLGLELTQLLIAIIIIGLGIGAFRFKLKNKKWYGTVEVVVGGLSALVVTRSLGPNKLDLAKWSALAGCAYVIARGLGNRDDAVKDAKKAVSPASASSKQNV